MCSFLLGRTALRYLLRLHHAYFESFNHEGLMQNGYSKNSKFNQSQIILSILVTKHDVKIHPIYHWTEKRIKTHIAICFMALSCM